MSALQKRAITDGAICKHYQLYISIHCILCTVYCVCYRKEERTQTGSPLPAQQKRGAYTDRVTTTGTTEKKSVHRQSHHYRHYKKEECTRTESPLPALQKRRAYTDRIPATGTTEKNINRRRHHYQHNLKCLKEGEGHGKKVWKRACWSSLIICDVQCNQYVRVMCSKNSIYIYIYIYI